MAYSTYMGEMAYLLTLDKTKWDQGVRTVKADMKGLERDSAAADVKLKSLSKDVSQLGGSLAAMGGLAMGAGLALGNNGLGAALTSAGMGLSIVGGSLATIKPALQGMAVVIEGQLIPALVALNTFLGPTGWIIIGLGLAAAAVTAFIYKTKNATDEIKDQTGGINTNIDALKKLADAYDEVKDAQDKLAGIPKKKEELEFELAGAKIDEKAAYEAVQKGVAAGVTGTDLEQLGYSYLSAQRRRQKIEESLANLPAEQAAAQKEVSETTAAANWGYSEYLGAGSVGMVSQGGNVTGLTSLNAMVDQGNLARKYEPQGYIQQTPINQTNNINVTVASVPEAKDFADRYTDSRILALAKKNGTVAA